MIRSSRTAHPSNAAQAVSRPLVFALLAFASVSVFAQQPGGPQQDQDPPDGGQGFEGYVSEDALQVMYVRDTDVGEFGRNALRAGFFINEDRDLIGVADMLIDVGEPDRRPYWSLEVGPRVYGALLTIENQDIFAIALGGRLSYYIGRSRRTSASVSAFYAPDIITFGIADNVKDVTVQVETQLTEATRIFVGYRMFEFDLPIDREVDDGLHIGIRHRF